MATSARHLTAVFRLLALLAVSAPLMIPARAQNPDEKPRVLKVSVAVGPAFALGKAAQDWAKLIAERSGGTLAVDIHPGATLAGRDADREFAALRDGAADLAVGSTLHWSAQIDELSAVGLPWLAPEPSELAALATGDVKDGLFSAVERAGAVPLALAPLDHRAIITRTKIVRVPDDLRGLRIRITPSRFLVDFYAGLGALPFSMPFSEASSQFRGGALDAQEGPVATFAAARVDSVGLRSATLWGAVAELAVFAVNRSVWDKWTVEQRALVRTAAEEAATDLATLAAAEHEAALTTLKSRDIELLRLTRSGRAAFAAAARPIYDKWAAVAGVALVRAAEAAVAAQRSVR